ncbi:DNA replication protein [Lelliottia amnigena]|uniref:DNA replication terminus site-binding protein n=1 Tax=Lelliottia TaxID=1330545 RepID=UPI00192A85FB|nr:MULTISPECIES: DNA replication terminus site-binding protein [Lelliottia]MBL5885703.1 DNA replication protein [Lelliottia aquatilis]MBL5923282.1 DNA replication protein [Lelliottia amnigena]MBL5932191.1 DNA replication protein [Lelliottia amnigena]
MTTERLTELRDVITAEIGQLGAYLDAYPPVCSIMMKTHPVTRHDERKRVVNSMDVDVLAKASNAEILDALSYFSVSDITTLAAESTKITQKFPGVVIVPGDPRELGRLISAINTAKKNFAMAMRAVELDKSRRFEKVHEKMPGLIVRQSTRSITFVEGQLKKVTFSWRLQRNHEVKDRDQLLSMLEKRLAVAKMSPTTSLPEHLMGIESAIEAIEHQALKQGESYRLCRVNAFPVPIAHLFVFRGDDEPRAGAKYADANYRVEKSSLPVFATGRVPEVKVLEQWQPREPGVPRKQRLEYRDLLPGVDTGIFIVRNA